MSDPIDVVEDAELRSQLRLLRANYGTVIESSRLGRIIKGFRSQKGIYKPSGSRYALWVRQTLRGVYPDEDPRMHPDTSWTYRYSPEGRAGRLDMSLDTNKALLRCLEDRVPVGVLRQLKRGPDPPAYEVLGLAYVQDFDGTHFVLQGESNRWDAAPTLGEPITAFRPFEEGSVRLSLQVRRFRDQRFGIAVRFAYHNRCSLCEIGYRIHGRSLGLDAAHIIPLAERGTSSDVRNGMLLCGNHHVLFDEFAWTPDEDLRVVIVDDDEFRRSAQANCVLDCEGKRLPNLPTQNDLYPATEAISYRLHRFGRRRRGIPR